MPLHDWTDDRGWDSVHPLWLVCLVEYVQLRLPEGYRAFLGGVPSLSVGSANGKPDNSVRQWGPEQPAADAATDTAVLDPDAEPNSTIRLDPQRAVHIDFHGQLVAAIELVSPRNKDRADAKEAYSSRYLGYLRLGVHLLLVDVLPRPKGFSFADALTGGLGLWTCRTCRRRWPRPTGSGRSSRSGRTWVASSASGGGRWASASRYRRCPSP